MVNPAVISTETGDDQTIIAHMLLPLAIVDVPNRQTSLLLEVDLANSKQIDWHTSAVRMTMGLQHQNHSIPCRKKRIGTGRLSWGCRDETRLPKSIIQSKIYNRFAPCGLEKLHCKL